MKLSAYADKVGVSYRTAWRWFKAGKAAGYQVDTGTIIITDPTGETVPAVNLIVVEHKDRLTRFGFNYIEQLLAMQGRKIEAINLAKNG
jgi:predicted site-specific integrase-resolvase